MSIPLTRQWWLLPLLRLILACNLVLLVWYVCFGYRHMMHSDSAVMNLLAQEILETGSYFPPDWYYANNDLWVLFTHTLALPFAAMLPNGMAVHAGAGLMACAIVLHATWMLGRALGQSVTGRTASLVIVSAGWSVMMAETMFGQAAYGLLYAMAAYVFAFACTAAGSTGKRRRQYVVAAGLVLLLAFWANPQRAAVTYAGPLLAAALALLLRARRAPLRAEWKLGLALLAFAVAGVAAHQVTMTMTNVAPGLTQVSYLDLQGMAASIGRTLQGLLLLFNGLPHPGSVVTSVAGIGVGVRLAATLALAFVVLPWAVAHAWSLRRPAFTAALAFGISSMAVSLFFMLATTLPDPNALDGSIRYMVVPLVFLMVFLAGLAVDHAGPARPAVLLAWAALLPVGVTAYVAYQVPDAKLLTVSTPARPDALLALLRQHGLAYGYGTFWNAGRFSVLSDGAVRIRPVSLEQGVPMPVRHLGSGRWYHADAWQGRTFLLLDEAEAATLDLEALARHTGQPEARLRFENWHVIVFPHNIAHDIAGWDLSYRRPLVLPPMAGTPRQVGQYRNDPAALVAAPGEAGMLAFGPGIAVQRGRYLATFDVGVEGAEGAAADAGSVDVVSAQASLVHGARPIMQAGRQRIAVPFTLDRMHTGVELRVRSSGQARLALYGITLQAACR